MLRKYPPCHYTHKQNHWYKAVWSIISCCLHQIQAFHSYIAAEIDTYQTRQSLFTIFYCPYFSHLWQIVIWESYHRSGTRRGLLPQDSTCFAFLDAILNTSVLKNGYSSYCCVFIIQNQSDYFSPSFNKEFPPTELPLTGIFLFLTIHFKTLEMAVRKKILVDKQFLKYPEPPPFWH